MYSILIVDDDRVTTKLLGFLLSDEGYSVTTSNDASEALAMIHSSSFDLIMLDVMMPGMDGFAMCHTIRQTIDTPIVFISGRNEVADKIHGLKLGADDYITKPFDTNELLARIWALLRRRNQTANTESVLKTNDFVLDPLETCVKLVRTGKTHQLTPIEARMLRCLVMNAGRCLTRDALLMLVWGIEHEGASNHVDVYIKRLRAKIERDPGQPELLLTIRGIGYKYQPSNRTVVASA